MAGQKLAVIILLLAVATSEKTIETRTKETATKTTEDRAMTTENKTTENKTNTTESETKTTKNRAVTTENKTTENTTKTTETSTVEYYSYYTPTTTLGTTTRTKETATKTTEDKAMTTENKTTENNKMTTKTTTEWYYEYDFTTSYFYFLNYPKIRCWMGKVRPCAEPLEMEQGVACWRSVVRHKQFGRHRRHLRLDLIHADWKLVLNKTRYVLHFLEEVKSSQLDNEIHYLCIFFTGYIEETAYSEIGCWCIEDLCNEKPLHPSYTYLWYLDDNDDGYITENELVPLLAKYTDPSESYHLKEELPFPRAPSANVSSRILNCANGVKDSEFLTTALRWELAYEDTDSAGCPNSTWVWQLDGKVTSWLNELDYHFQIKLQACARLLNGSTSWAFLSKAERVFSPCDQLSPGESSSLQVDYAAKGHPLYLSRNDIKLHPTPRLRLQCRNHHSPPPPPLGLDELRSRLWIAIAVCLVQVALVTPLLVIVVIRLENASETVSSIVSMTEERLSPFRLFFSVSSDLVESFAEVSGLGDLSDEFRAARAVSNAHRQLEDFNFFGWRTGFDYRLFPCFGTPPEVPKPVKCTCPDCQHPPRISLARLIKPARLLEMGLQDWALVDRKDPLYTTFHGVRTEEYLPVDSGPTEPSSTQSDTTIVKEAGRCPTQFTTFGDGCTSDTTVGDGPSFKKPD